MLRSNAASRQLKRKSPIFVFEFNARDLGSQDDDGYKNYKNSLIVTVTAESEVDAEAKAASIVARDEYKLNSISEVAPDGHALSNC
jgi:hypothetical protein